MTDTSQAQKFVLLPARGLRADNSTASDAVRNFLYSVENARIMPAPGLASVSSPGALSVISAAHGHPVAPAPPVAMRVLDSIAENGAKLVEITPQALLALRAQQPGLRLVPVVYYQTARAPRPAVNAKPKAQAGGVAVKIKLTIVSAQSGQAVPAAHVVAFTDFANKLGVEGDTNSRGEVALLLGGSSATLQRLYIYPKQGFWGALKKNVTVSSTTQIGLKPLDLSFQDGLRFFHGQSPDGVGAGLKVAVVDTGVAAHPDLVIDGGFNSVTGEVTTDFGDNGEGHGTHVAGIIAARGLPPSGLRGVAPGVTLRSYRCFGQGSKNTENFAMAKAIDRAVQDECDLINMSISGGPPDDLVRQAIEDARQAGCLVIVAAGNNDRAPVGFPALDNAALAVSALGRKGTFPAGVTQSDTVARPFGTDKKNFIATFSNIGREIDLTGPGVGILSTVPGGYAPMDGTSMACPAVTGLAAKLLASTPNILALSRNQARSDAMAQALLQAAQTLGFALEFEGHGLVN